MRGLPPVPQDVAHLIAELLNDGARASVGFWIQMPGLGSAIATDVETVFDTLISYTEQFVNALTPISASVDACRLIAGGSAPFSLVQRASPNVGAWSSGSDTQVATGVHWETTVASRRGAAITHVPWTPDQFSDDHLRLNNTGFTNIANAASTYIAGVAASGHGTVPVLTLGTLYRQFHGAPMSVAEFVPFFYAVPTPLITTIRRRMRQAR